MSILHGQEKHMILLVTYCRQSQFLEYSFFSHYSPWACYLIRTELRLFTRPPFLLFYFFSSCVVKSGKYTLLGAALEGDENSEIEILHQLPQGPDKSLQSFWDGSSFIKTNLFFAKNDHSRIHAMI